MPNVSPTSPVWSTDQLVSHANSELARKQDASARLTGDTKAAKTDANAPDKDMFMKLMLAQLKYQNPLEPTDTSAFVNQTAQMNMVEQLTNMTKAFEQTVGQNNQITATSMLGHLVSYDPNGNGEMVTSQVIGVIMGKNPSLRLDGGEVIPLKAVQNVGIPETPATPPAAAPSPGSNATATQNPASAPSSSGQASTATANGTQATTTTDTAGTQGASAAGTKPETPVETTTPGNADTAANPAVKPAD